MRTHSIEDKIRAKFGNEAEVFIAIAKAESGMNPNAQNVNTDGSVDRGLLQINSVHGYNNRKLFDVDYNINAAYDVYRRQGLTAWTVVKDGSYLKYLN